MVGNENLTKLIQRLANEPLEKEVPIYTPMGEYMTTETLKAELIEFMSHDKDAYAGAIGGRYNYIFTETSLGLCLTIEDSLNKRSINVTNHQNW